MGIPLLLIVADLLAVSDILFVVEPRGISESEFYE
jgi:hypothetical protein